MEKCQALETKDQQIDRHIIGVEKSIGEVNDKFL